MGDTTTTLKQSLLPGSNKQSFFSKLKSNFMSPSASSSSNDDLSKLNTGDMIIVLSPIIIAIIVTALSFFNQNWKGIIYLAFLIGTCLIRNIIYRYLPGNEDDIQYNNKVCDTNIFTKYEKGIFSPFVFAFTIVYLFMPMFINKGNNWWLFSFVLAWFVFDVFIRYRNKCIIKVSELFFNIIIGGLASGIIVLLMNIGGSSKYLFFNETQSDKQTCTQPSKQTFQCDVYKDGKLVQTL